MFIQVSLFYSIQPNDTV